MTDRKVNLKTKFKVEKKVLKERITGKCEISVLSKFQIKKIKTSFDSKLINIKTLSSAQCFNKTINKKSSKSKLKIAFNQKNPN